MLSFFSRLFKRSASDTLSPADFVAQRDPSAPLLDVRTRNEFASGHLRGALHADVLAADFRPRVDSLVSQGTLRKDGRIYLYCRSGDRSARAVEVLRQMGFTETINVGGFGALRAAGADME